MRQEREPVPSDSRSTRYHMPNTAHKKQEKLRAKKVAHTQTRHRHRQTDNVSDRQQAALQLKKLPKTAATTTTTSTPWATPFDKVKHVGKSHRQIVAGTRGGGERVKESHEMQATIYHFFAVALHSSFANAKFEICAIWRFCDFACSATVKVAAGVGAGAYPFPLYPFTFAT